MLNKSLPKVPAGLRTPLMVDLNTLGAGIAGIKPIKCDDDSLAISTHAYHNHRGSDRLATTISWTGSANITPHDREVTQRIAEHFEKQILITRLRTGRLSSFQTVLEKYLESDRTVIDPSNMGMIYRLPEYYYRDVEFNRIITVQYNDAVTPSSDFVDDLMNDRTLTLTPVGSTQHNTSVGKNTKYWFKDTNLYPVMIQLNSENILLHIWDRLFARGEPLNVKPKKCAVETHPEGLTYIKLNKWELDV